MNKKYIKNLITRVLISIIFLLSSLIFINSNTKNYNNYKKYIFTSSLAFNKFNKVYSKYMGKFNKETTSSKPVFNELISYKEIKKVNNGVELNVGTNYLVPTLQSGIVVFLGEKDNLGKTLIVQGIDGVDVWYTGVNIHEIKLYDYVEKGSLLGESINDKLIILIHKNGKYLDFNEYIKEI